MLTPADGYAPHYDRCSEWLTRVEGFSKGVMAVDMIFARSYVFNKFGRTNEWSKSGEPRRPGGLGVG